MLMSSALWLIAITLIFSNSIEGLTDSIRGLRSGDKSYITLILINVAVIVMCGFAFAKHLRIIHNYDKQLNAVETSAPQTDTLSKDANIYDLQDNYQGEIE